MRKLESKKIVSKKFILEFFFIVLLVAIFMIKGKSFENDNLNNAKESIWELSNGWYYIENGEKKEISLPHEIISEENPLIIYNEDLTQDEAGLTITTKAANYDLIMSYGDEILYQYDDGGFPRNTQTKSQINCDGVLPNLVGTKTLKLEFFNEKNAEYNLPIVYIGVGSSITSSHYKDVAFKASIAIIMIALSIFAFGVGIYMKRLNIYDKRFVNVSLFLIICSIWCLTDSVIVQQTSYHYQKIYDLSFYSFMLLAVPMLHFLKNTFEKKEKKCNTFDILIVLFYVNAILQGILNYFGYFEFIEMLFATHLLLGAGCMIVTIVLLKEYNQNKTEESKAIVLAFNVLIAAGILALVLYWALKITYYSLIFEIGILIFIGLLLKEIIRSSATSLRTQTEIEILQQLAREDRLTEIGNRRAFEECISELEREASTLKDALLIFIDINFLKLTNDKYGHSAGDELIKAAAVSIKNTFGNDGHYFRIGGDEFCIVLKNPKKEEIAWYKALEEEICRYNSDSQYELSMAKGGSYLREKNGSLKSINEWKYQADQNMYKDKARSKWNGVERGKL